MIACTRCGHWHTDAERASSRNLSCSEVKQFWFRIKDEHNALYGHPAQVIVGESGTPICSKCRRQLGSAG
jgi:hypothetical protein